MPSKRRSKRRSNGKKIPTHGSRASVYHGNALRGPGTSRLMKEDLRQNCRGRIVSKAKSVVGRRNYHNLVPWQKAAKAVGEDPFSKRGSVAHKRIKAAVKSGRRSGRRSGRKSARRSRRSRSR